MTIFWGEGWQIFSRLAVVGVLHQQHHSTIENQLQKKQMSDGKT